MAVYAASPAWRARSSIASREARVGGRRGAGAGGGGRGGGARGRGDGRGLCGELGESTAEEPCVQPGKEEGVAEPAVGDLVPVRAGDALDEAVDAQSSEGVGGLP